MGASEMDALASGSNFWDGHSILNKDAMKLSGIPHAIDPMPLLPLPNG